MTNTVDSSVRVLVEMEFGSHLYGTAGPDSDRDYKGVFAPTAEQVILGRIPKSIKHDQKVSEGDKNQAGDVDREFYSLPRFVDLACQGQTVALDMLHARQDCWIVEPHPAWLDLVNRRSHFYTRDLKAFTGYSRKQAAKYGLKGSRLSDCKKVRRVLRDGILQYGEKERTSTVWQKLPKHLEHARHLVGGGPNGERQYLVCGITLQDTAPLYISLKPIENYAEKYGKRARQAERNEGVDFKALSHAYRAAYQVKHILEDGDFSFPLPETDRIVAVKRGEVHAKECLLDLDSLIDEVESLASRSELPEAVEREAWDDWLLKWIPATSGLAVLNIDQGRVPERFAWALSNP